MNEKRNKDEDLCEDPGDIGFESQEIEDAFLASVGPKLLKRKAEIALERKAALRKNREAT
jgi:hypothetical protein